MDGIQVRSIERSNATAGERTGFYRPLQAHGYARTRRSHSRRNFRLSTADWDLVQELLKNDWSPEQIAGWLRRYRILEISHETILSSRLG